MRLTNVLTNSGYSAEVPDQGMLGKLRHYFGKPLPEAMDISLAKVRGTKAAKVFDNISFRMHFRLQLGTACPLLTKF